MHWCMLWTGTEQATGHCKDRLTDAYMCVDRRQQINRQKRKLYEIEINTILPIRDYTI